MGRRLFTFNPPSEGVGLDYHRREITFPTLAAPNRFARNCVLDGKTYRNEDHFPAFLKGIDAIDPHALAAVNLLGEGSGAFGEVTASADLPGARNMAYAGFMQPWTPGGTGVNAWAAYRLPEGTLCDRYLVWTKNAECPLGWRLEGSHSGNDDDWAAVHQVDNTGVWAAAGEEKVFTIPPETRGVYEWYRIKILASNVAATRLYQFRLFRPDAVCARGEVLLDASVARPIVLSFADGYAADGAPIDHVEMISAPVRVDVGAIYDWPFAAGPQGVSLYAVRDPFSGAVSFELRPNSGDPAAFKITPNMRGNVDQGFVVSGTSDVFEVFDGNASTYTQFTQGYTYDLRIMRAGSSLMKINLLRVSCSLSTLPLNINYTDASDVTHPLCSVLTNGTHVFSTASILAKSVSAQLRSTSNYDRLYDLDLCCVPRYRYFAGRMHRPGGDGISWEPAQVIWLGDFSCKRDAGTGAMDVCSVQAGSQFIRGNGLA